MSGTDVWVWVGHVWSERTRMAIDEFGDRITDVSIFCQFVNSDGTLEQTFDPELLLPYRDKWPHIRFWLGYRNDGIASIFTALRNSAAAQQTLTNQLEALLDLHPWMVGVDTDLEQGGGSENSIGNERIFQSISDMCHARGQLHSAALPPLTSTGSVGGENWVRYAELGQMLDHICIMSYDFAWRGSAPGPISPGFWMRNVYDWATTQVAPSKLSWGLPLYSYFWDIHDYPDNELGWRGDSGPFYAAYGFFSGHLAANGTFVNPPGDGSLRRIGWIVYRDVDSQACWGLLECYDWVQPTGYDSASGVITDAYDGRRFVVRYGLPSASTLWDVTDNGPGSSEVIYLMTPREAIDYYGDLTAPDAYNLTLELLQRTPVAATIIDDFASGSLQLYNIYNAVEGAWDFWEDDGYKQYRGRGRLDFNHDFGTKMLYVQMRFQMAAPGTVSLYCKGYRASVDNFGTIQLFKGNELLGTVYVDAIPTNPVPGDDPTRRVMALRVRENSVRLYYGGAESNLSLRLTVDTAAPTGAQRGVAGMGSTSEVWIDHTYLGDGWWYQPREAVEVSVDGGAPRTFGRIERTGVTWDSFNRFRPDTDIEEFETREESISLDWMYVHWVDVPVETNQTSTVRIVPVDHDVWIGRSFIFNKIYGRIAFWQDAQTITYWKAVAGLEYGISGVALWTVGQEDVRIWDAMSGGELEPSTRVVQG